jgi:hypothetical protein
VGAGSLVSGWAGGWDEATIAGEGEADLTGFAELGLFVQASSSNPSTTGATAELERAGTVDEEIGDSVRRI